MTTGARWRVVRAGQDGLAVDTLRPLARFLVMACATGFRLARKINRRGRRIGGNHLVRIVAILTRRRVVMTGFQRQAMHAGVETFRLPRVTQATVNRRDGFVVVGMFGGEVGVATEAGVGLVRGQVEFGRVHKQRNRLAGGIGFEQRVIAVTIKTIAVFQAGQGRQRRDQEQRNQQRETAFHPAMFRPKGGENSTYLANYSPIFEVFPSPTLLNEGFHGASNGSTSEAPVKMV